MPYVIALLVANLVALAATYGRLKRIHADFTRSTRGAVINTVAGLKPDAAIQEAIRRRHAAGGLR